MSLRTRVVIGLTVIAVLLVGMAAAVVRTTEGELLDQIDAQLANVRSPGPIVGGVTTVEGRSEVLAPPSEPQSSERPSPLFVGVFEGGELRTIFAPNFGATDAAAPDVSPAQARAAAGGAPFTASAVSGDSRFRVRVRTEPSSGLLFVQALPLDSTDDAIEQLLWVALIATVVIIGVLALVAWWVVRLGVRPVKEMAHTATLIAGGDLTQRVPTGDPRTEAGELGLALNTMLANIEDAFTERTEAEARVRQFLADASHELRTPVTTIRGYAELYRTGGLDRPGDLDEAMRRTEQESVRMGLLVTDMMELARLDQGRPLALGPVDLSEVARDAARDAQAVDAPRSITVDAPHPVIVAGDVHRLHQVVANLVGNALVHTDAPIVISTGVTSADAFLEVRDEGSGMAPDVAARVFERFYRADPSRTRRRGGAGLGLSIVAAEVEAHGGEVELVSQPGRGTTVRVALPHGGPLATSRV